MDPGRNHRKQSYSLPYRIYRRIRYIYYLKRKKKKTLKEIRQAELEEKNEVKKRMREFLEQEKIQAKLRAKFEKEQEQKFKEELELEMLGRAEMFQHEEKDNIIREEERFRAEKNQQREETKRFIRDYFATRWKGFISFLGTINIRTLKKKIREFRDNRFKRRQLLIISFDSTVLFLLSYFAFYFLQQAAAIIAGAFFNYPTILYYDQVYFNISVEDWNHDSVKTIFSAGPIIGLLAGLASMIIYSNIRDLHTKFKMFFLWGFLHSVTMLFGAMLVGTLFETGIGYVISWMYIMDTGKVLYSVVSIFILVITGLMVTKSFLISANSYYPELTSENRSTFLTAQVFIPYVAGNILLILLREPKFMFYETFTTLTMGLSLLSVFAIYRSYQPLYFEEGTKPFRPAWAYFIVLAGILVFYRLVLAIGIRFGG